MVRLLFIRHAESAQNVQQLSNVDVTAQSDEEVLSAMRSAGGTEDGDFPLSREGERQAKALSAVWSPLLLEKAREGRLHIFVSPMKRCLQTADPLMRELNAACGMKALVKPSIMEFGGLTWPKDMAVFDEMAKLRKKGDTAGAMSLLKNMKWRSAGLSGDEIKKTFPWADLPKGFPATTPWHMGGFEGSGALKRRLATVMEDIRVLPESYGNGEVVVFVSHGGTIADLLYWILLGSMRPIPQNLALGTPSFEAFHNTSVTSVVLPDRSAYPFGPNGRTTGEMNGFSALLEFANNTTHLGENKLRDWAVENYIIKRASAL